MEPIPIPSVPSQAFNKNRRISDLVRKQVEHFKHIEEKLPADVRAKLPQGEIVTEADAARYIAPITSYLLSRPRPKPVAKKIVAITPPAPVRTGKSLALAAAAAPALKKSEAKKKSVLKKETVKAKRSPSVKAKAKKSSPKRKK